MEEKGATLVEIILVIFMITMFSGILVYNFPRVLKQFALSRVSYKLAQDLRRVEDLGLSGAETIQGAKGYGIYVDTTNNTEYILYADRNGTPEKFDATTQFCTDNPLDPLKDCILDKINIANENPSLYISGFENITMPSFFTSINFKPPNPDISIDNLAQGSSKMAIILRVQGENDLERKVWVNTSGLIEVK